MSYLVILNHFRHRGGCAVLTCGEIFILVPALLIALAALCILVALVAGEINTPISQVEVLCISEFWERSSNKIGLVVFTEGEEYAWISFWADDATRSIRVGDIISAKVDALAIDRGRSAYEMCHPQF